MLCVVLMVLQPGITNISSNLYEQFLSSKNIHAMLVKTHNIGEDRYDERSENQQRIKVGFSISLFNLVII